MANQDAWRPLFVGSVVGGSTDGNRATRRAISRLARIVNDLDWHIAEETGVDAVFHVSGPLMKPDYEGIRTGRFSKAGRLIAVQVAVPTDIEGKPEQEIARSLAADLIQATDMAKATVSRRKGALPIEQAVFLAHQVSRVLG